MEAHYGKLSILAILLLFAIPLGMGYSLEDAALRPRLRQRLCPDGMIPLAAYQIGPGGSTHQTVTCTTGNVAVQTGARFDTYNKQARFNKYDRFRRPRLSRRVYG